MTDYRELERIAANPKLVRSTAEFVLAEMSDALSLRATDFLNRMMEYDGRPPLSSEQKHWLHDLRNRASRTAKRSGFCAESLVRTLWECRLDLDQDSEAFLDELHARGENLALSDPQWRRVFAIGRQLGEIEHFVA